MFKTFFSNEKFKHKIIQESTVLKTDLIWKKNVLCTDVWKQVRPRGQIIFNPTLY